MILLASDHNGVGLKAALAEFLTEQQIPWLDFGPMTHVNTDYNTIAQQVANALTIRRMTQHTNDYAILCCGTGIGMSIAANKIAGARAALVHNHMSALKSREHNDANILCLGAWINSDGVNVALASEWLSSKFGEGRHIRRVEMLERRNNAHRIVFANGVFDILHRGHIAMLEWGSKLGDRLVVGINSDASTKALKGKYRPLNTQDDRKALLSMLKCVDEVLIFDETSPRTLIDTLRPQVIVHGGDFTADEVRERDHIPSEIEVKIFPRVEHYSTTETIAKAKGA